MATFTNSATLSYNGNVTTSNIVTGTLQEVLTATKTAITDSYASGSTVTYVVSLINSGATELTGINVTDNLGQYTFGATTPYPLSYVDDTVLYYTNGVLQATPTVTSGPPLAITGISVPAGGNATLIYETTVNEFAPLGIGGTIENTVTMTGGVATPVTATETITAAAAPSLRINKALSPSVVAENGQLTYTFTISNFGNTAATAADNIVLDDVFNPVLNPISVTFNGTTWNSPTNYTYNPTSGAFLTVAGQITVPAATYNVDPTTGAVSIVPGVSTLVVTGTV